VEQRTKVSTKYSSL